MKKWIKYLLMVCLAVVLVLGISATAYAAEGDVTTWNTSGTCEWGIDSDGCLWIRPIDGVSGTLGSWQSGYNPPWYNIRSTVNSVVVKPDVAAVICDNMFRDFYNCRSMDLSGLDTSNVTSMASMFSGCESMVNVDVSGFDTSNVISMAYMFSGCRSLGSIDISRFDMRNVTNTYRMFTGTLGCPAYAGGSLTATEIVKQQPINTITVGSTVLLRDNTFFTAWCSKDIFVYTDPLTGNAERMSAADFCNIASSKPGTWVIEHHGKSVAVLLDTNGSIVDSEFSGNDTEKDYSFQIPYDKDVYRAVNASSENVVFMHGEMSGLDSVASIDGLVWERVQLQDGQSNITGTLSSWDEFEIFKLEDASDYRQPSLVEIVYSTNEVSLLEGLQNVHGELVYSPYDSMFMYGNPDGTTGTQSDGNRTFTSPSIDGYYPKAVYRCVNALELMEGMIDENDIVWELTSLNPRAVTVSIPQYGVVEIYAVAYGVGEAPLIDEPVGDGTGNIQVVNAGDNTSYEAYQIFDMTEAVDVDGNTVLSYTIAEDSPWFDFVYDSENGTSKFPGLTISGEGPIYSVTAVPGFDAASFADALRQYLESPEGSGVAPTGSASASNGIANIMDLMPGYYMVVCYDNAGNAGDRAVLTTVHAGQTVRIQNKNDMPFDKTVNSVKVDGVQVGDIVDYQLSTKVPAVDDADTFYEFSISDTMDAGLDFIRPIHVFIGGVEVNLQEVSVDNAVLTGDQVRYGQNGKIFELSLDMLSRGKVDGGMAGQSIVITYQAKVNAGAVASVSENNAVLRFGNDPNHLTVRDSQTKVYDSQIIIDKFENGSPEQKLEGAEFVLLRSDGMFYSYDATNEEVIWVPDVESASRFITNNNGAAMIIGLDDSEYFLRETKAPGGYAILTEDIPVVVDGSKSITPGMDEAQVAAILTNVANVANTPGTVLPSTGGIGTTIFYVVGSVLVAGSLILLVIRKRNAENA